MLVLCRWISALSEENIIRRTQRCTEDCKEEPEELVQMCIQRCTYYLINPFAHSISHEPAKSTDENGLLVENEHLRTRVRLIGPDGLPTVLGTFWTLMVMGSFTLLLWSYAVCVARNPGNPSLRRNTVLSHGGSTPFIRIASSNSESTIRQRSNSDADSDSDSDGDSDSETTLTEEQLRQTQLIHTVTVKENGEPRFCLKCNAPKPDRTHHCSSCGICVLKMDHHCPWLNNCVGFNTHKAFLLFLAYTVIYTFCISITILVYYAIHLMYLDITIPLYVEPLFIMMLAGSFSVCLIGFGGFHAYLLLNNLTTIESYESNKFRYAQGNSANLFDLGSKRNFLQVFGNSWPHWFVPTRTSLGDGVKYPINFEAYNLTVH
ncbi:palmitoyltransferase for Vac8p [Coemansia sp. RSA 989]|nr:palmitoyltransferase for Vac8p [Coemansia sp. RSA 989]KAJ1875633.1 palmitoyltransferase for Vac8p [Coemansia sp. RSA 990]